MLEKFKGTVMGDYLIKGRRALPVGTTKEVNGKTFIKMADGTWKVKGDKSKKKKSPTGGQEKKPTGDGKKDNPWMSESKPKLKANIKKLTTALERFKNDDEKYARIKTAINQMKTALKAKDPKNKDKK
jgi:hypothetical protein|tara:strand:+ start:7147 stop:7530 length:384 start_codon:yes stop_codon:yes gene_type:complete